MCAVRLHQAAHAAEPVAHKSPGEESSHLLPSTVFFPPSHLPLATATTVFLPPLCPCVTSHTGIIILQILP